nr:unnamed protein product [Digitaria exilis]
MAATTSSRASAMALLLCALTSASFHVAVAAPYPAKDDFLSCLTRSVPPKLLFAKSSPAYGSLWSSTVRNIKFLSDKTVRPLYIITPMEPCHVQSTVACGRRHGMRLRVRSGGHDYEGLSYRSDKPEPFAVVDLSKMRQVRIDGKQATAWVDSGAQLGEIYYAIHRGVQDGAIDLVANYASGKVWGEKYFKGNFERLARIKAKVDPEDYFRNEQSIPPLLKY